MSTSAVQLTLFGAEEAVVVRRSARARRLALRVYPHGVVEVVAPLRAGERSIRKFVHGNASWIAKVRGGFRAIHGDAALSPPASIELAALGECWDVTYAPGKSRPSVLIDADARRIAVNGPSDAKWQRAQLRAWLMAHARATLVPWLSAVSEQVELPFAGVTIRRQRTRWGSCSARRTISLNCALLFIEPALVRHLFVHELAHTRHLNHSRAYWRLVARLEPDFEALERRLRDAWTRVPAWVSLDPPSM